MKIEIGRNIATHNGMSSGLREAGLRQLRTTRTDPLVEINAAVQKF